jgi:S-(hydroxymethyl)glutathione dehydrogenase/alcohol dehydrogenase
MSNISFKAAVLEQHKKPLKITPDIKVPPLKNGQILVKLAYSGVCHSQIMEIDGLRGEDKYLPHLLGHEGSGLVLDIGPKVKKVKKGDTVVLGWIKGKGIDSGGCSYECNNKTFNAGAVTTFNEYAVISENRCVIVPKKIPMDIAALFGCAVLTGSGIMTNTVKPKDSADIAFFGIGGIGISALAATKLFKLNKIFAVDINNDRLELAKEFGATHVINPLDQDPVAFIKSYTDGQGVDYSIDAAGQVKTIEQAFESIKFKDGLCVFASHPKHGEKISIDPFDLISGKRILGSWGGEADPDRDIPIFSKLYLDKKLPLDKLITKKYKLENINDAIQDLKHGKVIRPIIELDTTIKNNLD